MMGKIKKLWNIFITWATPIWNAVWGWIKKAGKLLLRLFLVLLATISSIAFLAVPFLNNVLTRTVAQWIWFPATLLLAFFVIMYCKKEKMPSNEPPVIDFLGKWGAIVVAFSFLSAFVLNYYDIDLVWKWIIAGVVAVYAPLFFFSLLAFDLSHNQRSLEEKQKASLNTCKNIVLYWLFDLFYLSIVNDWLVPMFVFGIMALIIVAINLSDAFLNGAKSLRFFIALELVLSLVASVFLIYKIPNCTVQDIVLTISAALIGGVFTLLGVAWTIKKGEADRRDDLLRIEKERRDDDRKKFVPFINLYTNPVILPDHHIIIKNINFADGDMCETYTISGFTIKNTDFTPFCIVGFSFNGFVTSCSPAAYIDRKWIVEIGSDEDLILPCPLTEFAICATDLLGNMYKIPLDYSLEKVAENRTRIIPKGSYLAAYIEPIHNSDC